MVGVAKTLASIKNKEPHSKAVSEQPSQTNRATNGPLDDHKQGNVSHPDYWETSLDGFNTTGSQKRPVESLSKSHIMVAGT